MEMNWTNDQCVCVPPCLHPVTETQQTHPPPTWVWDEADLKNEWMDHSSVLLPCQIVASEALASSHWAPPKQVQDTIGCDFISTTQRAVVT